jgi:hypothetical protein
MSQQPGSSVLRWRSAALGRARTFGARIRNGYRLNTSCDRGRGGRRAAGRTWRGRHAGLRGAWNSAGPVEPPGCGWR